ncbi:MAG: TolC family protein [Saprospiraceae bacterium]|nr:TolC family protein [Candidatus Defluviibacterium haderslevense]
MKYKIMILKVLVLAFCFNANGQSNLEAVLVSVEKNNKLLMSNRQFWEAKKLEYKTGLTLPNPTIQGQFLFGSPEAAGNQTDFFVVQPFDFPTTYKKRKELAAVQGAISISEFAGRRQDILQEAKLACIEMVYRNKLKIHYERRKLDLEKLQSDFQTKLNKGDGNILDVNKTKLQLLEINQLNIENNVEIQKLQMHLIQINGGEVVVFQDTIYPTLPELTTFEQVEMEYKTADPMRQTLEHEQRIAEKQLELSKTWRLPKFEVGYHYQGILGQRFNGIHAGLTLPIWEQKYRKREQQANVLFTNLKLQSHLNEHFFEIKELFDRQDALKKSFNEYSSVIASISNITLLDKALRLGEITVIEYFLETSFYQNALLHLLKLEKEYHVTLAEIMKYRL